MPGQILAELKQTKPFPTLEEEAAVSLARTQALVQHAAEEMGLPKLSTTCCESFGAPVPTASAGPRFGNA